MSAPALAGTATMLRILERAHRRGRLAWIIVLVLGLAGTAQAVVGLYRTQDQIDSYAAAATGGAIVALNGKVEGLDTLGGIVQNEFGFLAGVLVPLLGISLVAQGTRREEETGRLEILLGGAVGRAAPTAAALGLAALAIVVTAFGFATSLAALGIPPGPAALYAAALGALALLFAALAAVFAHGAGSSRGVYTGALLVLAVAYVVRGVGDAHDSWVTWLSPLGWVEKTAPFGAMRPWVLAPPLAGAVLLAALAVRSAARRDLGSAWWRSGGGAPHASRFLRTPIGLAARLHRPGALGWTAGSVLLAGMMGVVAQQFLDAIAGNPSMGEAVGITSEDALAGFEAMTLLYLAVLVGGYAISGVGVLRAEESEGRLEARLSGTLSRSRWLAAHALVVLVAIVVDLVLGTLVFALGTVVSLGDSSRIGATLGAGMAYLPAVLVLGGLALLIVGWWPRLFVVSWLTYAAMAFIAFLGPALRLPGWVENLAPTTHVGNPPHGPVDLVALAVLTVLATGLIAAAFLGFRRRGIPQ